MHKSHDGILHEHSHLASVFIVGLRSIDDPFAEYSPATARGRTTRAAPQPRDATTRERGVDRGAYRRRREDDPCSPPAVCRVAL